MMSLTENRMALLLWRRSLLAACAALHLTKAANADDANDATKMSEDVATYGEHSIALQNFERVWPKGKAVPKLIFDIATLISPWPKGDLGYFFINASRTNDYFIENGADLWSQFGIFMSFPNGTEYAIWYYDGCPAGAEPVVSFGDEGDLRILAPNLKLFFAEWGAGRGVGLLEPFALDATPELLAQRKAHGAQILALVDQMPSPQNVSAVPDFESYINDFARKAAIRNDADPTLQAIKALLSKYIPSDDSNPRGKSWKLNVIDGKVEVETSLMEPDFTQHEPLPEREALVPLVTKARLEREAAQNDGRGPWTSGLLTIQKGGHTFISGEWA
jgi:hypothetical protein